MSITTLFYRHSSANLKVSDVECAYTV